MEEFYCECVCVCETSFSELKELNSSLTTDEMTSEIQELKTECAGHRARLEKIKSATNHVTPAEKEKVGLPPVKETSWPLCGLAVAEFCPFWHTGLQRAWGVCEGVEEEKETGNVELQERILALKFSHFHILIFHL